MRVYLGGPIYNCTDEECSSWRNELIAMAPGIDFINPLRRDHRTDYQLKYKEVVAMDQVDIGNSDVCLFYWPHPSVGSSMEMLYARQIGKPTLLVNVSSVPSHSLSPWILAHVTSIVGDLKAAVDVLRGWSR